MTQAGGKLSFDKIDRINAVLKQKNIGFNQHLAYYFIFNPNSLVMYLNNAFCI